LSGAAFAIGNLLLARALPTDDYGRFSLGLALFIVFSHMAPFGINQLMLRRQIDPSPRLLARLLAQGALTAMLAGFGAHIAYGVCLTDVLLIGLAITSGHLLWVTSAGLQKQNRRLAALGSLTAPDWILLAIGVGTLMAPPATATAPLAFYCVAVALVGPLAWSAFAAAHRVLAQPSEPIMTFRVLAPLGVIATGGVLVGQIERLVIPSVLDLEALAMFSVLTSVAIFPFRLVTLGAGFALTPRLVAARDGAAKQQVVKHELQVIGLALTGITIVVCALAPFVARWTTAGRYDPDLLLVLAACLIGAAKVAEVLPRAILTACGSERDLVHLSGCVWAGIVASVLGALLGAWAGLPGVLVGMAAGNLAGATPAMVVAYRALQTQPEQSRHS
jgi:O-antigen/teichoic acid export membrane protein